MTTFEYESNQFKNAISTDRQSITNPYLYTGKLRYTYGEGTKFVQEKRYITSGAGLRIKKIVNTSRGNTESKTFKYVNKDKSSSGILNVTPITYAKYLIDKGRDEYIHRLSRNGFQTPITETNNALVNYSRVEVHNEINGEPNGYEVYRYSSYSDTIDGEKLLDHPAEISSPLVDKNIMPIQTSSVSMARGKLLQRDVYTSTNDLVQTDTYQYTKTPQKNSPLKRISQLCVFYKGETICNGFLYRTYLDSYFPSEKVTKIYSSDKSGRHVDKKILYTYTKYKQLASETHMKSDNTPQLTTKYLYPNDVVEECGYLTGLNTKYDVYKKLYDLHMISSPIATTTIKANTVVASTAGVYGLNRINSVPVLIEEYKLKEKVDSKDFSPIRFLKAINSIAIDSALRKSCSYGEFDCYNNPCYIWNKDSKVALIWGYKGQYVVGKIENADLHSIRNVLDFSLNQSNRTFVSLYGYRKKLPHAQITEYRYSPSIGLSYSIDERGIPTGYRYDDLGRLIFSASRLGANWKINNVFDYQYKH